MVAFITAATIALVASLASSVNAVGCFSGGQSGDCSTIINSFCGGGFTIDAGAVVSQCFNVNDYHCNLQIENTAGSSQSINAANCEADMLVTNNGCNGKGGIRQDGSLLLTVDPNAGSC